MFCDILSVICIYTVYSGLQILRLCLAIVGNQVKGLDEDESKFLEFVENRQQEISKERNQEEKRILAEMKISFYFGPIFWF